MFAQGRVAREPNGGSHMNDTFGLDVEAGFGSVPLIEVGERERLHVRVRNNGDARDSEIRISARSNASLLLVTGAASARGSRAGQELTFVFPPPAAGEMCEIVLDVYALCAGESTIGVSAECGGAHAETRVQCTAHGRARFDAAHNRLDGFPIEIEAGEIVRGHAVVTNSGNVPASVLVRVDGDLEFSSIDCGGSIALAAGERRVLAIEGQAPAFRPDGAMLTIRGLLVFEQGELELGPVTLAVRGRARLTASIETPAPPRVPCGSRVDWRVHVTNCGGAPATSASVALVVSGGAYVAGSTRIAGATVLENGGTSPLWTHEGLRVEELSAGAAMTLECSTVAELGSSSTSLRAHIVCDGNHLDIESRGIGVDEPLPATLPYFVRDVKLAADDAATQPPQSAARAPVDAATARRLQTLGGLVRHLWAIPALFAGNAKESAEIAAVRAALRSVFDRLSIKVLMPYYDVRADDVLDSAATAALGRAGCAEDGTVGARLARAATLLAAAGELDAEIAAYRDAVCARLGAFRDDAALIDALLVSDRTLDERLDAALLRDCFLQTA